MKYLISIFISISYISLLSGQQLEVVEVESNKIISFGADQSWNIVNDWTRLNELAPQAVKSTTINGDGINSTWKIELLNGGTITEKMVYYDAPRRTMSYIMTETPMPIEDYLAIIKVEPYGIKKALVSFYTMCKTQAEKVEDIKNNFKGFPEIYLSNLEKLNNE